MPRALPGTLGLVIVLALITSAATATRAAVEPAPRAAVVGLQIDGGQQFQVIDGFGVNAVPKTWEGGAARPAIDLLVAMGATIWRVDVGNGHSDWEATNDDGDPLHFNWSAYNALYASPAFEDLWSMLSYLNSKGATIELSLSGLVPPWMGDTTVAPGMEEEFVEEVVSLAYYARRTRGIAFTMLSPVNEPDHGPTEGVSLDGPRLADLFHRIATRLDSVGMGDVELVGPETTSFSQYYTTAMLGDPVVMAHVRRLSYHSYSGCCAGDVTGTIAGSAYADRQVWLGEWSQSRTDGWLDNGQQVADEWAFAREMTNDLLDHLASGVSAALAWDAWDNWHEHQPCCPISHWGQVAKNAAGVYQPKKRYFSNEQVFRFVRPGMRRIGATSADPNVRALAFSDAQGVTIVGRNAVSGAVTLRGTLSGTSSVTSFAQLRTSASEDLARGSDVAVAAGTFSVDVPGDSFFTLTTVPAGAPPPAPTPGPAPTPPPPPTSCSPSVGPGIPAPAGVPAGIPGLHAAWFGQSGYPTLCAGQRSTATVAFYNSGSIGWVRGRMGEVAYLGTWGPEPGQDQPSPLGGDGQRGSPDTGWPRYDRIAVQPADYVGPGQVAWFQFTIQAPATRGTYRLYLRPVIEGASWLEDYGVYWVVTVQ